MLYEALVTEVLPQVAGVRVRFRDLVPSGFGINDYVRVLSGRMSKGGGASLCLPEVGDHGIVGMLSGGTCVWLGSSPFLDQNQVDPTPGLAFFRHRSGLTLQARDNGDCEVAHPSGFRITIGVAAGAMPSLERTSKVAPLGGEVPHLEIIHPSGAKLTIDASGAVILHSPGPLSVVSDGALNLAGATVALTGTGTLNGRGIVTS
jgi:hypothetical protein